MSNLAEANHKLVQEYISRLKIHSALTEFNLSERRCSHRYTHWLPAIYIYIWNPGFVRNMALHQNVKNLNATTIVAERPCRFEFSVTLIYSI